MPNKKRILLAEDEETLLMLLQMNLESEGYTVTRAITGKEAIQRFSEEKFDMVILDVMMPEIDGISVCESIRLKDTKVPILFLSAKGTGEDKVRGLKAGGNDYVAKPFNLEELLLRIKNWVNLPQMESAKSGVAEYSFGQNYVNFESYMAKGMNGMIKLTKKETLLLKLLIEHENEVVSREKILHTVWGYAVYPTTRTIDNFILSFRKYFEPNPDSSRYFLSIPAFFVQ